MSRSIVGMLTVATVAFPTAALAQRDTVLRVPVSGVIELGLAPFVGRAIREAEESPP